MSAKKINHIGIAVPSINDYLSLFENALGLELEGIEEVTEQGVRVAFIKTGESRIELLEPLANDSPVGKFIDKRGNKPGFHHLALEVDDIEGALERARKEGLELIDKTPREGAGGVKIAFIHPKSAAGVLTELCEHEPSGDED